MGTPLSEILSWPFVDVCLPLPSFRRLLIDGRDTEIHKALGYSTGAQPRRKRAAETKRDRKCYKRRYKAQIVSSRHDGVVASYTPGTQNQSSSRSGHHLQQPAPSYLPVQSSSTELTSAPVAETPAAWLQEQEGSTENATSGAEDFDLFGPAFPIPLSFGGFPDFLPADFILDTTISEGERMGESAMGGVSSQRPPDNEQWEDISLSQPSLGCFNASNQERIWEIGPF